MRRGDAVTQALLGLLEDARVEALACRDLPGRLLRLWATWHTVTPADGTDFETLMLRLARTDRSDLRRSASVGSQGQSPLLPGRQAAKCSRRWRRARCGSWPRPSAPTLARCASASMRELYRPGPSYRDDNRWLWHSDEEHTGAARAETGAAFDGDRPTAESSPGEPLQWRYPRMGSAHRARAARLEHGDREILSAEGTTTKDFGREVDARLMGTARKRMPSLSEATQREGEEIDLDAAVQAMLALRQGRTADDVLCASATLARTRSNGSHAAGRRFGIKRRAAHPRATRRVGSNSSSASPPDWQLPRPPPDGASRSSAFWPPMAAMASGTAACLTSASRGMCRHSAALRA